MKKRDVLIPAGLIVLTLVPAIAGAGRLVSLAAGGPVTAENARFFGAPTAVALHVIASCVFGLLGALQFSPGFRKRYRLFHRAAGSVAAAAGIVTAVTGLYMTLHFPRLQTDGPTLFSVRMLVGTAMTMCVALSVRAVLVRRFDEHGAWMMRAYALGLGAGTQVFTHLPWLIATGGLPTGYTRDTAMAAAWLINIAFVEWRLRQDDSQAGALAFTRISTTPAVWETSARPSDAD